MAAERTSESILTASCERHVENLAVKLETLAARLRDTKVLFAKDSLHGGAVGVAAEVVTDYTNGVGALGTYMNNLIRDASELDCTRLFKSGVSERATDQAAVAVPAGVTLGGAVVQRRADLGMTQEQVAERGGPSVASMRTIEGDRAEAFRPKTLSSLDKALGWQLGTSRKLLDAEPVPGTPAAGEASDGGE